MARRGWQLDGWKMQLAGVSENIFKENIIRAFSSLSSAQFINDSCGKCIGMEF